MIEMQNLVFVGDENGKTTGIDLRANAVDSWKVFHTHDAPVNSVSFDNCDSTLASASDDGTVCLFDIRSSRLLHRFEHANSYVSAVVKSSPFLYAASGSCIFCYETRSYEIVSILPCTSTPTCLLVTNSTV